MNTNSTTVLDKVRILEKELNLLKMEAFWYSKKRKERKDILKETFGILGENFPSGIDYENRIRKEWRKRFKTFKL